MLYFGGRASLGVSYFRSRLLWLPTADRRRQRLELGILGGGSIWTFNLHRPSFIRTVLKANDLGMDLGCHIHDHRLDGVFSHQCPLVTFPDLNRSRYHRRSPVSA